MRTSLTLLVIAAGTVIACGSATPTSPSSSTSSSTATAGTGTNGSAPTMFARFQSSVTVGVDGSYVTLKSNGTPDHKSPYWGAGNALYESPQAGMQVNPNRITAQALSLRVPSAPLLATPSDTPLGPMGIAVNGVAIFNQYAAGRTPLTSEILSFDRYNGHPQQTGQYHYHIEPLWLTTNNGPASLIGVLVDGFPIYGPKEADGSEPSGLDSCNGHSHATADVPAGIYHYHVTAAPPYIAGCYRGTPGTVG